MKIARRKFPYRSEESQTELRFSRLRGRNTRTTDFWLL